MSLEAYLAYLVATVAILILPGPTVMLVVSCSLTQGKRAALPLALGVGLGDLTSMTASLAGLGALLAASATWFAILKWVGAAYLIYLGVKTWRSRPEVTGALAHMEYSGGRENVLRSYVVTATNPKAIAFFCAFLPQFIDHTAPVPPQICLLGATFLVLAVANVLAYALLASRARGLASSPRAAVAVNRLGGGALIGAGVLTAALRRA